ncbi:hypothetical protein [Streptomyces sp. NPDC090994]|uniref:hypothetical protein n=1 Tax=Streptomyces sp. NPDC090994 TaxID=3365969 RepID=UPI00380060B0
MLTEAVAAAILTHPDFVAATPDEPCEDTITVQTRGGIRYQLVLGIQGDAHAAGPGETPAAYVAAAADQVLTGNPNDSERSVAELLNHVAATWDRQDLPLREHAQAVARALTRKPL